MEKIKFKFEELKPYHKVLYFVDNTVEVTKSFPKKETYGLTSQYKSTSISIILNITEGTGDTDERCNKYLNISNGFVKGCMVGSTIANRLDYLTY